MCAQKWAPPKCLVGKVCLVTGASRGIGKGIALQLAEAGALVYITSRTLKRRTESDKGTLEETAKEIEACGGKCIPVVCDHMIDKQVDEVFEKIKEEQKGRLDVLVNCAFSAVQSLINKLGVPFWEQDPSESWDEVNQVALRNHYRCAVLASRMMVEMKSGLIINISSAGGIHYFHNVPYGVGKEACDRMAVDCALELKPHNVACLSIWPGPVKTELVLETMKKEEKKSEYFRKLMTNVSDQSKFESPEFTGRGIVHLAADPKIMSKTGRIWLTTDLALEYGYTDANGLLPTHFRSVSDLLSVNHPGLARFIPGFVKIPKWAFAWPGNKF